MGDLGLVSQIVSSTRTGLGSGRSAHLRAGGKERGQRSLVHDSGRRRRGRGWGQGGGGGLVGGGRLGCQMPEAKITDGVLWGGSHVYDVFTAIIASVEALERFFGCPSPRNRFIDLVHLFSSSRLVVVGAITGVRRTTYGGFSERLGTKYIPRKSPSAILIALGILEYLCNVPLSSTPLILQPYSLIASICSRRPWAK